MNPPKRPLAPFKLHMAPAPKGENVKTVTRNLDAQPNDNWVFRTLALGGWDYEANPILVVTTLELVKDENSGKLIGSNVIFDFVDPRKPSQRVAVMTKSLIEVLDQIKAAYTLETLASEGKR